MAFFAVKRLRLAATAALAILSCVKKEKKNEIILLKGGTSNQNLILLQSELREKRS